MIDYLKSHFSHTFKQHYNPWRILMDLPFWSTDVNINKLILEITHILINKILIQSPCIHLDTYLIFFFK